MRNPESQRFRRVAAVAGAVGLLLLVVYFAARNGAGSGLFGPDTTSNTNDPTDCVTAMIMAEISGDVDAYLECFAGPLRETLEARMASKTEEEISAQLRGGTAELTAHATKDLQFPEPDTATLVLERIYREYNEQFDVRLERIGDEWKIVEMTPLERYAPEIPYGTPVYVPPPDEENGNQK